VTDLAVIRRSPARRMSHLALLDNQPKLFHGVASTTPLSN